MSRACRVMLGAALVMLTVSQSGPVRAAVTEDNFKLGSAADLVALCAADRADPMMTAAVNFCHGFAVGVYQTLTEFQAARKTKLFCLSNPAPTRTEAIANFVDWAKATPSAQAEKPADAILHYLTQRHPCTTRR